MKNLALSDPYREAIRFAVVQQLPVLLLTGGILDGGTIFAIAAYAAIGFWAGVAAIRWRRPVPSKTDLFFIRFSYLPLCIVSFFIAGTSHHWNF